MASKRKNSNSVLIGKKKYTIQDLQNFSLLHYYYINQLLGDQTLRAVIMEQFPMGKNKLISEKGEGDFANSSHHLCMLAKNKRWCSVNEDIQNLDIHSLTASTSVWLPVYTGTISAPFFLIASTLGLCLFMSLAPINILHLRPNFLAAIDNIFPA